MTDNLLVLLLVLVVVLLGLAVVLLFGRRQSEPVVVTGEESSNLIAAIRASVEAQIREVTTDAVWTTQTQAGEKLAEQTRHLLDSFAERIKQLDTTVGQLRTSFEAERGAVTQMNEALSSQIRDLGGVTGQLAGALKSSSGRGAWGENQLRNIVDLAGMTPYTDVVEQATVTDGDQRLRPDMLIRLPNQSFLVIDAKVPLAAYLRMQDAGTAGEREALLREHVQALRTHVRALADKKYWERFTESPDFVIMFVPGESFLGDALREEPSLLEDAMKSRVVLASPMSLMALLLAVARGWQTRQITENAGKVAAEAAELYRRFGTVLEKVTLTGRHLERATVAYNEMVASVESRLLPSLRRFRDLGVSVDPPAEANPVDRVPRHPAAPEATNGSAPTGGLAEADVWGTEDD